jgi:transcriptional regulator with XRE-family HTH domain
MDDLRTLRRARFLTQKELAAKVGVSYQTIQGWESGGVRPRLRQIPKLAEALNVDPAELATMLKAGSEGNGEAA